MPELPDVACFGRYLEETSLRKKVRHVEVNDASVLQGVSAKQFQSRIEGRSFRSTRRHGKHLLAELDKNGWLVMHFGMTGYLVHGRGEETMPKHARVVFHFSGDQRLGYVCQRKLGHLALVDRVDEFLEAENLGPDALDEDLSFEDFRERLAGVRAAVKSALMNQDLLAGIGNVYGDEILFHAGVHPARRTNQLDEKSLKAIYRARRKVLETAIERGADPGRMPKTYLLPHRDEGERCPRCGGPVETTKISGRTTYLCGRCQA